MEYFFAVGICAWMMSLGCGISVWSVDSLSLSYARLINVADGGGCLLSPILVCARAAIF